MGKKIERQITAGKSWVSYIKFTDRPHEKEEARFKGFSFSNQRKEYTATDTEGKRTSRSSAPLSTLLF